MKNGILLCLLALSLSWVSCKKKDETPPPVPSCVAGTGGNVTLVAFPQHHGKAILSRKDYLDSAFVKFNTQDPTGTKPSDFDAIFVGEEGEDHVHLKGLKCGKYYIMMTGFDTTIHQRVKGGLPLEITETSGEKDINFPVSE